MYTVISCFCWWRCTPGPTFVSGRLERNCCCCAVVLLNESLAVCSLSAFLMEVTWDAWPKDIWVYWLLHSQHVSEDILKWSIHGKYYTDDIHTYQQQISLLFGLKMQGPLADVGEHIYCQRFQGSWFGRKAPKQENFSRLHNYWSTHWFLHVGTCSKHPNSPNQHIADVVATLFAGCLLQKGGQYLYCMTQPKR